MGPVGIQSESLESLRRERLAFADFKTSYRWYEVGTPELELELQLELELELELQLELDLEHQLEPQLRHELNVELQLELEFQFELQLGFEHQNERQLHHELHLELLGPTFCSLPFALPSYDQTRPPNGPIN